jgi:hypothetical protein
MDNVVVYAATDRQAVFHAAPEMFKLYGGAMGGGKTWALCAEAVALSCDYPGNRGYICRNTNVDFTRTTYIVLDKMLTDARLMADHHKSSPAYYDLVNGSRIYYGGLDDSPDSEERLRSFDLGWFAIDEASETQERYFLTLASRLRLKVPGIRYFGLLATNPDPGWIKARFVDRKRPDHVFVPALPTDNPHLPADYVVRLKSIFPEDWQKRFVEGDWGAFEGTNCVFPYAAINLACGREMAPTGVRRHGVDVARFGDDEGVIAEADGPVGSFREIVPSADLMTFTGKVVIHYNDRKPETINVDADGMGAGVVDRLKEQRFPVAEIHGGARARDPERFSNRKAEIYWGFRERLIANDLALPDDLELRAQLTSCTYKIKSTGQIEITSKDEMKKKGLKSPDRAEALIYAFAPSPPEPRIWRVP